MRRAFALAALLVLPAASVRAAEGMASSDGAVVTADQAAVGATTSDATTSETTTSDATTSETTTSEAIPDTPTSEANPEAPTPEAPKLEVSVNGYLDSRTTVQGLRTDGLMQFSTLPRLANITEGNLQLRLRWGDFATVYADTSLFWQAGGYYLQKDSNGDVVDRDSFDNPAVKPLVVPSELYVTVSPHPNANLTIGRKRIVWGPGLAQNPTDLVNPPKDPTDPTFQRAGSWLGRLEFPFENFTLSFVGAAKVTRQTNGLPTSLLYYPDYDTRTKPDGTLTAADADTYPHFVAAARLYTLFLDTDFNLFYFFSNQFNDAFRHKHRAGFSVSRVFDTVEVHTEVLLQQGSSRQYVSADCATSASALAQCAVKDLAKDPSVEEAPGDVRGSPLKRTLLDDPWFRAKALVGANWFFADAANVSVEYLFNMEGYTKAEFDNYVHALHYALTSPLASQIQQVLAAQRNDPGTPQKFTFEPLRQHYLLVSYNQRQIFDDFAVLGVLILGLEDLSGQFAPQVVWSAREWLNVTAGVFVPIGGLDSLGTTVDDKTYTEYGMLPVGVRGFLSVRAFY